MRYISYRDGYKYQLQQDYCILLPRYGMEICFPIRTDWIELNEGGLLIIKKGYAWDGPSGPAIDSKNFMRGSLVHDALYQLMREGHLDRVLYREAADRVLQKICIEDGMCKLRAWWVYQAVSKFADPCADPANNKPVLRAP